MKNADSYPPGLLEQYQISLERLKTGVGCEFIVLPGMVSRPSKHPKSCKCPASITVIEDPPEKGKRYVSFYVAMNHPMSRGTIVRCSFLLIV